MPFFFSIKNFEHLNNCFYFAALFFAHVRNIVKCQFRFSVMVVMSSTLSLGNLFLFFFCFFLCYFVYDLVLLLLTSFYTWIQDNKCSFEWQSIEMSQQILYQFVLFFYTDQNTKKKFKFLTLFFIFCLSFAGLGFMNEFIIPFFYPHEQYLCKFIQFHLTLPTTEREKERGREKKVKINLFHPKKIQSRTKAQKPLQFDLKRVILYIFTGHNWAYRK